MSFYKKTIHDVDLHGKRVLLRADYNVPLKDGVITDDYRIKQSLPTIQHILDRGGRLTICSHLGRPKSNNDSSCSLKPVAARLSELLGREVVLLQDYRDEAAANHVNELTNEKIVLLENLRYHNEEEANDVGFARTLAGFGEVFVQDAFGVVHRSHASLTGVPKYMLSVAGLLLEREVDAITTAIENPKRPLMAIIGGAKISDKIDILRRLIDVADFVAVGGAMANTFLLAKGIKIGKSLAEPSDVPFAKEILEVAHAKAKQQPFTFYLPQDGVVAKSLDPTAKTRIVDWDAHVIATIENYPKQAPTNTAEVADDELILDIGPFSGAFIAGGIQLSGTVIWNGAMGVTEVRALNGSTGPFAHGTQIIVDAMLGEYGHKPYTVLGGGDTVGYVEGRNLVQHFNHVSTGGGASMELMSGKQLPGVEALVNKE